MNKKDSEFEEFQIIYAQKGELITNNEEKFFILYDGEILNKVNNKISNFTFDKVNFNLDKYETKTTGYPKIQEVPTKDLFSCIYLSYIKEVNKFVAKYLQCKESSLNDIKQEFLKRVYKPIYLPLIALMCSLIILKSKESNDYNKFKLFLFILIFSIIVISEISLRFSSTSEVGTLFFILFPFLSFVLLYTILIVKKRL